MESEHAAYAYETSGIVAFVRVGDGDTLRTAGMNEIECMCERVDVDNDAHMPDVAARARTGEEHQVAALHFASVDGMVLGVLVAAGTANLHAFLAEDIAGKA